MEGDNKNEEKVGRSVLEELTEKYNRETDNWKRAIILMETTKYEIAEQTKALREQSKDAIQHELYRWSDIRKDEDYQGWGAFFYKTLKAEYEQGRFLKFLHQTGRLRTDAHHGFIGHPDLYSFYYNISSALHSVESKYKIIETPNDYADYALQHISAADEEKPRILKNMLNSIYYAGIYDKRKGGFLERKDNMLRFDKQKGQSVNKLVMTMRGIILFEAMTIYDSLQLGDVSEDLEDMLTDLVGQMREKGIFRNMNQRHGVSYPAFRIWLGETFGLYLTDKEYARKMEEWQSKASVSNPISGRSIEKTLNRSYKETVNDSWEHITSCMYLRLMIKDIPAVYKRITTYIVIYNAVKRAEIGTARSLIDAMDSKPTGMRAEEWQFLIDTKAMMKDSLNLI